MPACIDVDISRWVADFRERAELLARRCRVKIRTVSAVEYRAPLGVVVLQFSPTVAGQLLVGYNRRDWEVVHRLLADQHKLLGVEVKNADGSGN